MKCSEKAGDSIVFIVFVHVHVSLKVKQSGCKTGYKTLTLTFDLCLFDTIGSISRS